MAKDLAVILNDGSIESAVTTALAAQKHRVALVHTQTESPSSARRHAAFLAQAGYFDAPKIWTIPLFGLQPAPKPDPLPLPDTLLASLSPISLAIQAAARWDAAAVYLPLRTGPGADELAAGTEYLQILSELLQIPCARPNIELLSPILELAPWQLIDLGFQINAPFDLTWSCQTPGPSPCTLCPGCLERADAFLRAVKSDPLTKSKP